MIGKLTCAATGFLACGSAALGADLPVPEPVGFMRACTIEDDDGLKRYHYIPGTDTCLAVYGYARAESHYVNGDVALLFDGTSNSDFNNWTTRAAL
jgi:hypothetical protein